MNDNIVSLVPGSKEQSIPESPYVIVDNEDIEHYGNGFLIFTSHHIAIMKELPGLGALPIALVPIGNVKYAERLEDDEDATGDSFE
jgi:hypothetical protein